MSFFREVNEAEKSKYTEVQLPNEKEKMFIKKAGKESENKLYDPVRHEEAKKMKFDEETIHKNKTYETRYNKLFRKFEYNKVLTVALSYNIR